MRRTILALSVAILAFSVGPTASQPPKPVPLTPQDQKFQDFVRDFRAQAVAAGIRPATYDLALAHAARNQKVEDLNLNQPEFARPIWAYLDSAVSDKRVSNGQAALAANLQTLTAIEAKYGVPKEVLVSVWGNESNYGQGSEPFNMFEALATLAYDGPRTDFARPELIAALKMMQQQHYVPERMTSSWAGAFGQTQFVPSTFLAHAVDGDGDGTIDLWHSSADALASTANVLADAGWQRGNRWGYEIALPAGFAYELADLDIAKPVAEWKKLGVKTVAGGDLPHTEEYGAIFLPAGARGPAFMTFGNFKTILKYNNAASYALAVSLLADRIKGALPVVASWPRDEQPLSRDERLAFQAYLARLGYDIGKIDGILGKKARAALRDWQKAHGLAADGFPTEDLLTRVAMDAQAKH
ncbi:MAG TPA: lytic murein transglycosylase [Rhizomicrobium sp.]|nr:lytic murein transglycosylase [Rhizomicrobium sp.]